MEEICKFEINNNIYTIYDVDKIEGKENYVGRSRYDDRTIYIEKGTKEDMLLYMRMDILTKTMMKLLAMKMYVSWLH